MEKRTVRIEKVLHINGVKQWKSGECSIGQGKTETSYWIRGKHIGMLFKSWLVVLSTAPLSTIFPKVT